MMDAMFYSMFIGAIIYMALSLSVIMIIMPETSHDIALGIILISTGLITGFSIILTLILIHGFGFHTYFIFGGVVSATLAIFVTLFVKETFGLSDQEKKNIYQDKGAQIASSGDQDKDDRYFRDKTSNS